MNDPITWGDYIIWMVLAPPALSIAVMVAVETWFKLKDWLDARQRRKWDVSDD